MTMAVMTVRVPADEQLLDTKVGQLGWLACTHLGIQPKVVWLTGVEVDANAEGYDRTVGVSVVVEMDE